MKKIALTLVGSTLTIALIAIIGLSILLYGKEKAIDNNPKSGVTSVLEAVYDALYRVGISSNPKEVIVGRQGWLYANQISRQTIVVDQVKFKDSYTADAQNINLALEEWDQYLSKKGVKQFNVLIIPNKQSIYPEFLPSWATVDSRKPVEVLMDLSDSKIMIDSFSALTQAKAVSKKDVFYKTDSKLTAAGAVAAFELLSQKVGKVAPEIRWPSESDYQLLSLAAKYQGDLSKKIHSPPGAVETVEKIEFKNARIYSDVRKFDGNELLNSGSINTLAIPNTSNGPILISTKEALNKKKVLWIHGSSSAKLLPLMGATFAQLLIVEWSASLLSSNEFSSLIDQWHPDYVFFTLNEQIMGRTFLDQYPDRGIFQATGLLKNNYVNEVTGANDLKRIGADKYKISGGDPFIVFNLPKPQIAENMPRLKLNISCLNSQVNPKIPLQFFWRSPGKDFSEENSARFMVQQNGETIDLNSLVNWKKAGLVEKVRLDMDAQDCKEFTVNKFLLGN